MATYSELMKLKLPAKTDKYNIEDFNGNFTAIDTKIKGVENSIKQVETALGNNITTKTDKLQTQIDRLRYNEYVQFVKFCYNGNPTERLGYFSDIFTDYANAEMEFLEDGILIENSTMKMNKTYERHDLASTANSEPTLVDNGDYFLCKLPCSKKGGVFKTFVSLSFFSQRTTTATMYLYFTSYNDNIFESHRFSVPQGQTYNMNYYTKCSYPSGQDGYFIVKNDVPGQPPAHGIRFNSSVSGSCEYNRTTINGLPMGYYAVQCLDLLTTSYISKEKTARVPFDTATFYMRYNAVSGTGIQPYISMNNGSTWIPLVLGTTIDTTTNTGIACKEKKYTISGLAKGNKFKIKLSMNRDVITKTPEIYDYCLVYGE